MRRYLLDSNAVNAFVNRHDPFMRRAKVARARGGEVGTCEPVVAELRYGLEMSASRSENMAKLARFLGGIKCWPFDRQAAHEYGRIAADLRRRGRPIQIIDVMIAAVAMSLGRCTVITTDSDLSAVTGLDVEDWAAPEKDE